MTENKKVLIKLVEQNDVDEVIELLQTLSKFMPSKSNFLDIYNRFSKQSNVHSVVGFKDKKILAYGSIVIEKKIRGGTMGHIEDIVVNPKYQNNNLGKLLIDALLNIAKENHCYKVVLQCKENNVKFYEKCGFQISGVGMNFFIR